MSRCQRANHVACTNRMHSNFHYASAVISESAALAAGVCEERIVLKELQRNYWVLLVNFGARSQPTIIPYSSNIPTNHWVNMIPTLNTHVPLSNVCQHTFVSLFASLCTHTPLNAELPNLELWNIIRKGDTFRARGDYAVVTYYESTVIPLRFDCILTALYDHSTTYVTLRRCRSSIVVVIIIIVIVIKLTSSSFQALSSNGRNQRLASYS